MTFYHISHGRGGFWGYNNLDTEIPSPRSRTNSNYVEYGILILSMAISIAYFLVDIISVKIKGTQLILMAVFLGLIVLRVLFELCSKPKILNTMTVVLKFVETILGSGRLGLEFAMFYISEEKIPNQLTVAAHILSAITLIFSSIALTGEWMLIYGFWNRKFESRDNVLQEMNVLKKQEEDLTKKNEELTEQVVTLNNNNTRLSECIRESEDNLKASSSDLAELKINNTRLSEGIRESNDKLKASSSDLTKLKIKNQNLSHENELAWEAIQDLSMENDNCEKSRLLLYCNFFDQELSDLKKSLNTLKQMRSEFCELRTALKQQQLRDLGVIYREPCLGGLSVRLGGIEAEAAMLGQPMSMVLPSVVGFKLSGKLKNGVTATDLVLTATQMLRKHGVVGKFVEFYGEGMGELSLADRATIANMSPEYGATMGFFPVDRVTLQYLKLTGRSDEAVAMIEVYLRANNMFVDYSEPQLDRAYSSYLQLDLSEVELCMSGPKRPHDCVPLKDMKTDWHSCLDNKVGFKGFAVPKESQDKVTKFSFHGQSAELKHGSVVIAAITSCTNTSNPSVILGAGLVAKKACELGLEVKPWIKTILAPGSGVVTKYLLQSGLQKYLSQQGFHVVGYRCTTCIENSGDLDESVVSAIAENDILAVAVLSGNQNFEGSVHPLMRANYLASPPLVVAYALAGTVDIDFEKEPIGVGKDGKSVYFRDIWPSTEEVAEVELAYFDEAFSHVIRNLIKQ